MSNFSTETFSHYVAFGYIYFSVKRSNTASIQNAFTKQFHKIGYNFHEAKKLFVKLIKIFVNL